MARKSFVSGAIILMMSGFIVRILGFVYRIYLSNLIGAEGMGLFQLISPVYSLVILTLTSGISIAVSKTVAYELAKNHIVNLRRVTSCALAMVLTAGLGVSLFLYLQIDFIANVVLKDSRTYYSLLLLLPCIPVIAAASAIKGYFYGIQEVIPTAVSQIVEQIVRIVLVMLMAGYFLKLAGICLCTGYFGNGCG
jgi:stage V sporulation protein B